jgi:hypothetical protein
MNHKSHKLADLYHEVRPAELPEEVALRSRIHSLAPARLPGAEETAVRSQLRGVPTTLRADFEPNSNLAEPRHAGLFLAAHRYEERLTASSNSEDDGDRG